MTSSNMKSSTETWKAMASFVDTLRDIDILFCADKLDLQSLKLFEFRSKVVIFESLLTTFEESRIFGTIDSRLEPNHHNKVKLGQIPGRIKSSRH